MKRTSETVFCRRMKSPVGFLTLAVREGALTEVRFEKNGEDGLQNACADSPDAACFAQDEHPVLLEAERQIAEYFAGKRREFTLPLRPAGTPFQMCVWQALRDIPYGKTVSYKDVACAVGNEKACRAVGMANNKNPLSIVVPCHRVVGADGSMTGYGGGLWRKEFLLELENENVRKG